MHDRCIPFAADDILWHYHRKSNDEIGILKPLPHAKSYHLPLDANGEWVKQSVTPSSLTVTCQPPLTKCMDFYLMWGMIGTVECKLSYMSLAESIGRRLSANKSEGRYWQCVNLCHNISAAWPAVLLVMYTLFSPARTFAVFKLQHRPHMLWMFHPSRWFLVAQQFQTIISHHLMQMLSFKSQKIITPKL